MPALATGAVFLVVSAFLASTVEMVEALTIVLAVGVSRQWRSTLIGVGVALVALAAVIAALGPALALIPIDALRVVVGALLLIFGLQWLRKAILRASGNVALHDEEAIYQRELVASSLAQAGKRSSMDWYAFYARLQRRVPRGPGSGVHRAHIRCERRGRWYWQYSARRRRCSHRGSSGHDSRSHSSPAVEPCSREHHEVCRRRHADDVWDLLGR